MAMINKCINLNNEDWDTVNFAYSDQSKICTITVSNETVVGYIQHIENKFYIRTTSEDGSNGLSYDIVLHAIEFIKECEPLMIKSKLLRNFRSSERLIIRTISDWLRLSTDSVLHGAISWHTRAKLADEIEHDIWK